VDPNMDDEPADKPNARPMTRPDSSARMILGMVASFRLQKS
jgi:hypothetical protein